MPDILKRLSLPTLLALTLAAALALPAAAERLVTAVRDSGGNLKMIAWQVNDSGQVTRRGDARAGAVSRIAAAALTGNRVATAVRDSGGNLKVIVWDVSAGGNVTRRGDASAGAVSRIALTRLSDSRLATSVRDSGGNLKVIVWDVSPQGQVTRRGHAGAGAVSRIAAVRAAGRRLITAVRDSGGGLKLIAWHVNPQGQVIRQGDARAGAVSIVRLARVMHLDVNQGAERLATAVRDSGGGLKVIAWEVTPQGAIRREGDARAGAISRIAAANLAGFGGDSSVLGTAVRNSEGNLQVIFWEVGFISGNLPPGAVRRLADGRAGAVSRIAATGLRVGRGRFATAVRDSRGNLKVILWEPLGNGQTRRLGDARAGAVSRIAVVALP